MAREHIRLDGVLLIHGMWLESTLPLRSVYLWVLIHGMWLESTLPLRSVYLWVLIHEMWLESTLPLRSVYLWVLVHGMWLESTLLLRLVHLKVLVHREKSRQRIYSQLEYQEVQKRNCASESDGAREIAHQRVMAPEKLRIRE